MAVYTDVADDELRAFVALYDIGEVLSCKGIAEGVENSNFLVTTERGNFILTLYEKRVAREDLPFFIGLMEHLAKNGVACPTPLHGLDDVALRELCGRPAAMVTFLAGMWPRRIQPFHCAGVGRALAALHCAGASFGMRRANDLSVAGWRRLFEIMFSAGGRSSTRGSPTSWPASCALSNATGRAAYRPGSSMPICFRTTYSSATARFPA